MRNFADLTEREVLAVAISGEEEDSRLSDFVEDASGLDDCDGHGTAVAGVLAADPAPDDLLVGK